LAEALEAGEGRLTNCPEEIGLIPFWEADFASISDQPSLPNGLRGEDLRPFEVAAPPTTSLGAENASLHAIAGIYLQLSFDTLCERTLELRGRTIIAGRVRLHPKTPAIP